MKLARCELPLPPDPLLLARRLQDEPGLAFLWSADGQQPSYLAVRPVESSRSLDPEPARALEPPAAADRLEVGVPRWIGVVPYEARRGLERASPNAAGDARAEPHLSEPSWHRFGAVARVDGRVTVIGDDPEAVRRLSDRLMTTPDVPPGSASLRSVVEEPEERHLERVARALRLIRCGEIYQVNLARRHEVEVSGSIVDVLARLCSRTRPSYAAALDLGRVRLLSTSPELCLRLRDRRVVTRPIKGTRPRSSTPAADAELARALHQDPKENAELSMIVDVERNDLGRVCQLGSVAVTRPPHVTSQGLVWHRSAQVEGQLRTDVTRQELLEAFLPSGSVTGAPKVRAMEIIAQLEAHRRGAYTGALGFLGHSGELELGMAIRTLTVVGRCGHYFAGGGIVADSDPLRELEETRWKSRQLFDRDATAIR